MPTIKIKKRDVFTNAIEDIVAKKADSLQIRLQTSKDNFALWKDSDGNTLLHFAAFYGSIECFELLLNYNADLYARNQWGEEPLHMAIFQPNPEVMLNIMHEVIRSQRSKALDKAAARLHPLTLHDLALNNNEAELLENIKQLLPDANVIKAYWQDGAGFTPLHYAAARGHTQFFVTLCKHLIGIHANLTEFTQPNHRGQTPLHLAALHGHQNIIYYCLGEAAIVSQEEGVAQLAQACCLMGDTDNEGNTVWHYLVASQNVEALVGLFNKTLHYEKFDGAIATLYKPNHQGVMPLHQAIMLGNEAVFACYYEACETSVLFNYYQDVQETLHLKEKKIQAKYRLITVASNYPIALLSWLYNLNRIRENDDYECKKNASNLKKHPWVKAFANELATLAQEDETRPNEVYYSLAMKLLSVDCRVLQLHMVHGLTDPALRLDLHYLAGIYRRVKIAEWLEKHWRSQTDGLTKYEYYTRWQEDRASVLGELQKLYQKGEKESGMFNIGLKQTLSCETLLLSQTVLIQNKKTKNKDKQKEDDVTVDILDNPSIKRSSLNRSKSNTASSSAARDESQEEQPLLADLLVEPGRQEPPITPIRTVFLTVVNDPWIATVILKFLSLLHNCCVQPMPPGSVSPQALEEAGNQLSISEEPDNAHESSSGSIQEPLPKKSKSSKRSSIYLLSGAISPSLIQAMDATQISSSKLSVRRLAHGIDGFVNDSIVILEKSWTIILGGFLFKALVDYLKLPSWQKRQHSWWDVLVGKATEEKLASLISDPRLLGAWLGVSFAYGLTSGVLAAHRQGKNWSLAELEIIKYQALYGSYSSAAPISHLVLEILEIPALAFFLVAAPFTVLPLLAFKAAHLFKPGALQQLVNSILWDNSLTLNQQFELFDALERACREREGLVQVEAISRIARLVYHINPHYLALLKQSEGESKLRADALQVIRHRALVLLRDFAAETPPKHLRSAWLGRAHPRNISAAYQRWRLGLETNRKRWLGLGVLHLLIRVPNLMPLAIFLKTIIEGLIEANVRKHEAAECHEEGLLWRYVASVGKYACGVCPDLEVPYRSIFTNADCVNAFLNDSRTLEEWNKALTRLSFEGDELDLSAQTGLIEKGELPILLERINAHWPNISALTLNNKPEAPYHLHAPDLMAIANWTSHQGEEFFGLQLQYQRLDKFNASVLGDFAARLNPELKILLLPNNQLGRSNTTKFFSSLPKDLWIMSLQKNELNDSTGESLVTAFYHFKELQIIALGYNHNLTDSTIRRLINEWPSHPELVFWDFKNTGIRDKSIELWTNLSKALTLNTTVGLEISNCKELTDISGKLLALAISENVPISALTATNNNFTSNTLRALTKALPHANLTSIGMAAKDSFEEPGIVVDYLAGLKRQGNLLALDLSNTELTSSSLTELAELILKLPSLESLYLDNTRLTNSGLNILLPALAKAKIKWLSLTGNPLTDQSINALRMLPPQSLARLILSNTNITEVCANDLGQLLQKVQIEEIVLSNNNLGNNFTEIFASYLPGSNLKRLDLENCKLIGSAPARDLREVLTSAQIPDDWLGDLDTSTLRSIATGNPGTNLTWINLANNQLDDAGATVLCQVLPGTEISVNNLLLESNPVSRVLLQRCGDLGLLSSPASQLQPSGPYIWVFKQWQLGRIWIDALSNNIFSLNNGVLSKLIPTNEREVAKPNQPIISFEATDFFVSTGSRFVAASLQAAGFTLLNPALNYILKKVGFSQDKSLIWSELLQTFISLSLTVWRSPIQGLAFLLASAFISRILPNTESRQFTQILLTVSLFGLQSALQNSGRLEYVALQIWISLIGALVGQTLAAYTVHSVMNTQNSYFTFWKKSENRQVENDSFDKSVEFEDYTRIKLRQK